MTCNSQSEPEPMESDSPDDFRRGSLDFDHWTSLISETENAFPDDIERICSVYDSFLAEFPLCHGYWRRYADHKVRLCSVAEVVEVFERAVQSATYSVPLWVDYCNFSVSAFEDASDICRLFERGMSCVGKDYSCHALWDKYIEFEYSRQQWSSLAQIFIQALSFPTKKLHRYYESLKNLAALCEEEMKCQSNSTVDLKSETVLDSEVPTFYRDDEIAVVVRDLLDPEIILERSKALQKYICIGKQLYQEACQLDGKLGTFEINIRRSYFHVKPLDACQLENWHRYLDFVEMQGDFDWTVKLYERCLIPCANYPEFWMRYVDFMEINGGREIANYALDRATQVLLKRVSVIHLFNARFKEQIGDVSGAHSAFLQCNAESDSHFVKNVMLKANMEKRRGCFTAASTIYKEALEMAEKKKKLHTLPILYVRFSQLTHMMTDSADAARDVLIDGIKHLPNCKSLLEELISFAMMHGGKRHLNMVESAVANAISPVSGVSSGLDAKDAEDISSLYLEFVDLCGTIHEVRKAWNRHVRLFPYSTRTAYFAQQATFTTPLKMARGTEETLVAIPKQPSGDYNSDSLIELPLHDRNMLLRDNPNIESDQDRTDQISDLKLPSPGSQLEQTDSDKLQLRQPEDLQESMKVPYTEVSREQQSRDDTPEASFSSIDLVKVKQVSPESSEEPKGNSGPNSSSVELGCQVAEGNEFVESAQEDRSRNDGQQHRDNKSEQELKPLSLERLSLNSQENRNIDLIHSISLKCEASQETSTSNERKLESNCKSNEDSYMYIPGNARSSDRNEVVSRTPTQALSQPAVNSYGDWRQNNRSGKVRRDSRFGSRGRLQRRSYQQKPASPQKYLQTETGGQMPGSLGLPSQFVSSQGPQIHQRSQDHNPYQAAFTPANIMAPNAWPVQTVQQPNFASSGQPQLPVQSVAPQVSQDSQPSILGNGQNWMQNNQAYNQMWQYYYYQQQQQFLLQQQMQQAQQQQQPQQQQQLLLQQYQQQQLQLQQYYAQMQQQQPYQQQQQLPLQQQQYSPQLQMQQQQLQQPPLQQLQQQPQLHEQQLPLQQQPQLHEQQLPLQQQQYSHQLQLQPQLHEQQQQYSHQLQMQEQQLQQQPQLHEQQNMFYVQQHQQPVQQPSSVQEQQQQQISSSGIQHDNHYHEDPAAIPPENPDGHGTVVSSVSPHTPKESPQK